MSRVPHSQAPIVPGASWTVRCACGFARDVVAKNGQDALDRARADHDPRHTEWLVDAVDYSEHPLHRESNVRLATERRFTEARRQREGAPR